jgi:hypothetical protein
VTVVQNNLINCQTLFFIKLRGAEETSTSKNTANLLDQCKTTIARKFSVAKDNIVVDCDAISIIISTRIMTEEKQQAITDFMHIFGSDLSGCSLPHRAVGASKASGLFGCSGNMCQHLPECLQGQEMLVLDTPVKVGLHMSCKKKLVFDLNSKGYYLSPSNSNDVCFDVQVANKPPYGVMIDAIINSCCIDGVHVLHVADIGSRYPITTEHNGQINKLFKSLQAMSAKGILVELAQCDIASVTSIPNGMLLQVSCDRNHQSSGNTYGKYPLVDGLSSTVFPIHSLPDFEGKKLCQRDSKGTVLLSRTDSKWRDGKEITIVSHNGDTFFPDAVHRATDLFASSNTNGLDALVTSSSSLFSVKVYSTIAHALLQKRQNYPLSLRAMYGIGNRNIDTIQTLIKNIDKARQTAFDTVRTHGIGVRIEVSIRPHHNDCLRKVGHFNDILLHVLLAILGLCYGRRFKVSIGCISLRPIETKAMELVSQCMAMLKFRHESQFNEVYANLKVVEWLRAHLSNLLITIGICPQYGVKYINAWLQDNRRYDPYNAAGANTQLSVSPADNAAAKRKRNMLRRLEQFLCSTIKLNQCDVRSLIQFITAYPDPGNSPKECYKKLSYRAKVLLPTLLVSEIIPFISGFMSGEKTITAHIKGPENAGGDRKRNRDTWEMDRETKAEDQGEEDDDIDWFCRQEFVPHSSIHEVITKAPMPSDPLCLAIHALFQVSSFSDPGQPGFTARLFGFIFLSCRAQLAPEPEHQIDSRMLALAARIANGNHILSQSDLRHFCAITGLCGPRANKSSKEYLRLLCYHFQFPCEGVNPKPKHRHPFKKGKEKNLLLNKVMEQDLATVLKQTPEIVRIHRNKDNTVMDIFRPEKVAFIGKTVCVMVKSSHRNLYCVLAKCFNTTENGLRESLHRRMSYLQTLEGLFLGSNGITNKEFRGAKTLAELQILKGFQLLFTGKISDIVRSQSFPPDTVLPIVCLVYKKDISFYDQKAKRTIIYTGCNLEEPSRVIKYEFKGLEVTPKLKQSIIISLTKNGEFQWNDIVHPSDSESQHSNFYNHHYFSLDPFGGRKSIGRNAKKFLPNQTVKRSQPFYHAMSTLLSKLDPHYINQIHHNEEEEEEEESNNSEMSTLPANDTLGIIPFVEQLYSCARPFTGFGRSVKEHCVTLNLALSAVLAHLKSMHLNELNHSILCPIVSLQHKLSFGVLEIAQNNSRSTHFYSFNPFSQQVEYKQFKGYTALIDCQEVLYLFFSTSQTGYYLPSTTHHWKHDSKIKTNFSYLSSNNFGRVLQIYQHKYKLDVVFQYDIEPAQFRPETTTIIVPTNVMCQNFGSSLPQMIQHGIGHHALILIFPCQNSNEECWDTCIVHHPLQEQMSALSVLQGFLQHAPPEGRYSSECVPGKQPENCEASLYMILYAFIAKKTKSLSNFKAAMEKLVTEDDLSRKVRMWVHQVTNKTEAEGNEITTAPLPMWIEQLIIRDNSS